MNNVQKKFKQASYFFQQMELTSFDKEIYEANFEAFVGASRSITFAMQKENKKFYDNNIQNFLIDDSLMSFFNKIRTFCVHEGDSKINAERDPLRMRHGLNFDGQGGCIASVRSRNGDIIKEIHIKSDPRAEIFLGGIGVSLKSGLWEKSYFFDEVDKVNLENREIISVTDFCYQYLEKLSDAVNLYSEGVKS